MQVRISACCFLFQNFFWQVMVGYFHCTPPGAQYTRDSGLRSVSRTGTARFFETKLRHAVSVCERCARSTLKTRRSRTTIPTASAFPVIIIIVHRYILFLINNAISICRRSRVYPRVKRVKLTRAPHVGGGEDPGVLDSARAYPARRVTLPLFAPTVPVSHTFWTVQFVAHFDSAAGLPTIYFRKPSQG